MTVSPQNIEGLISGPSAWPPKSVSSPRTISAVALIFLGGKKGVESDILLIRRSTTVRSHRGQIGFPGGHAEASDQSPFECAARETWEEVGIPKESLNFIGQLPMQHALSGALVIPVICTTAFDPQNLVLNAREVDSALMIPWWECSLCRAERFNFNIFGIWRESVRYQTSSGSIWGLTAKILESARLRP